ncbi:phage tail protein [Nocardioides gilvus]|uniref:phage tail protein n=1 Tax=Nocardioides gilvus TaxID=1735589 RepID=UPI000D74F8FE|nr:tail fiber protein [Nocardioides gilvus]
MSTEPYVGAIQWVSFNFAPRHWALCNGQLLSINQYQVLFALLGTTYGGNGVTTFALPDLQGRTPIGVPGGAAAGESLGESSHTLLGSQLPQHAHTIGVSDARATSVVPGPASAVLAGGNRAFVDRAVGDGAAETAPTMSAGAVSVVGGTQPHDNMQPFLTLNAIICLNGIYPNRS